MEKQIRKELLELCQSIIDTPEDSPWVNSLTQVQMLYEKLIVINYLKEQQKTTDSAPENNTTKAEPLVSIVEKNNASPSTNHKADNIASHEVETREADITHETENELQFGHAEPKSEEPSLSSPTSQQVQNPGLSINESFGTQTLKIGLNDRIAFVKHLFSNQQEDYIRVISQLNTFTSFDEAKSFLDQFIRPEYNWDQKEEYEERFMELIKIRFGVE